jgi:hypothetical protein
MFLKGRILTIGCHKPKKLGGQGRWLPGRSDYTYSKNATQPIATRDVAPGPLIKQQSESSPEIQARQKIPFFGIFPLAEILRPVYTTSVGWEKFGVGNENNGQSNEGSGRTDEVSNPMKYPPIGLARLILPRWTKDSRPNPPSPRSPHDGVTGTRRGRATRIRCEFGVARMHPPLAQTRKDTQD